MKEGIPTHNPSLGNNIPLKTGTGNQPPFVGLDQSAMPESSNEEEQSSEDVERIEKLIEENISRVSSLVRRNFSSIARGRGIALSDIESEGLLRMSECARTYRAENSEGASASFYAYYKVAVLGACNDFVRRNFGIVSLTAAGNNIRQRLSLILKEQGTGRTIKSIEESEIPLFAKILGTRPETLRSIIARQGKTEDSLDEIIGDEDGDGRDRHEIIPSSTGGSGSVSVYNSDPESLMIRQEQERELDESSETEEDRPENRLEFLIKYLPKESRQILRLRYVDPSRDKKERRTEPYPYEKFCRFTDTDRSQPKKHGLALSPSEAAAHEAMGISILREFANGNFTRARYFEVVKDISVERLTGYINLFLSDKLERQIATYTFLKKRTIKRRESEYENSSVPMMSPGMIATRYQKELEIRAGGKLNPEQARNLVFEIIESIARKIAEHEGLLLEQQKI